MHLLVLLALTIITSYCVQAQVNPNWKPLACKDGFYVPDDAIMKELPKCFDPAVYGQGPDKLHPNCGFYCQAKLFSLTGPDGHTSLRIFNSWVDTSFPEKYKAAAKDHFKECFDKYGNEIDHEDPECKIADAFTKCCWESSSKMPC